MFGFLKQHYCKYLVRVMKITGDGEQCEISFNATDDESLKARLVTSYDALQLRMEDNNRRILEANDKEKARVHTLRTADPKADRGPGPTQGGEHRH